jgi:hypothetical protein
MKPSLASIHRTGIGGIPAEEQTFTYDPTAVIDPAGAVVFWGTGKLLEFSIQLAHWDQGACFGEYRLCNSWNYDHGCSGAIPYNR